MATTKPVDKVNEYKYLNNVYTNAQKTGNTGLANWAVNQGKSYGVSVGNQSIPTTHNTNTTSSSSSGGGGSIVQNTNPVYNPQTQQTYDPTADIERLKQAQIQSKMNKLESAKNQALSNLNKEKSAISPMYQAKRNLASTQNQIQARNFAEYYAQRGQNNPSGVNGSMAQNDIANNIALQNNMSNLNMQETLENQDITRRTTDVNNAYETDKVNALADIDSNTLQALINARQQADTTNYNRQQDELQRQISTLSAYENNYAEEIQKRKAMNPNDPTIPYLEALRGKKIKEQEATQQKESDEAYKNALAIFKETGIATGEVAKRLGVKDGTKTEDRIKTDYATNKPYYKPTTAKTSSTPKPTATQIKNQNYAEDYKDLKALSYAKAKEELTKYADNFIAEYGPSGYDRLWNDVLKDAIAEGVAKKR